MINPKTNSNNTLSYGRGYVYSLQYHIVFCTKYRKQVLSGKVVDECKEMMYRMADEYKFSITALEIMPEHVHVLVYCRPQFFIPNMVKIIKGNIARWLFMKHPELKRQLWGGHLWNPSYCVTTVSDRTTEIVTEYINSQKSKN